jgi:NTE family protein
MAGNCKQALVLSGGSIKGAYQAGAIQELFKPEYGFSPSMVYGISVGSINAAVLADFVGQQLEKSPKFDLQKAGESLAAYWKDNIRSFKDLGTKRCSLRVLWEIIFGGFGGMLNMDGLAATLKKLVRPDNVKRAAAKGDFKFYAGTLNLTTGDYFTAPYDDGRIVDYVMASAMMPIVMPLKEMLKVEPKERDGYWLDGGVHNVAPLSAAIEEGCEDIICIVCRPEKLARVEMENKENLKLTVLGERISDVIAQTLLDNDLTWAEKINGWVQSGQAPVPSEPDKPRYREVLLTVIRPEEELVFDIEKFTEKDILEMANRGQRDAQRAMRATPDYLTRRTAFLERRAAASSPSTTP